MVYDVTNKVRLPVFEIRRRRSSGGVLWRTEPIMPGDGGEGAHAACR
jgi:hypothetical protein